MPIHDQGYRRYAGERAPLGRAWTVVARAGIRGMLARRGFIVLLLLAWLPFLIRAVQIYASANLPEARFLAPSAQMFRQFLDQQDIFLFFITVFAGAGLIANDRRANALQIYLSKPLTRVEYVAGKLAVLIVFLLLVGWLPAMLLLVVQVMFAGNLAFFTANLLLVPAITLFALVQVLTIAFTMLALSSLSKSSRFVAILYAGIVFFTQAIYGVLYAVTRDSTWAWMSIPNALAQIGDFIFRQPPRYATPVAGAAIVLLATILVSAFVLERRVRGVEVVS